MKSETIASYLLALILTAAMLIIAYVFYLQYKNSQDDESVVADWSIPASPATVDTNTPPTPQQPKITEHTLSDQVIRTTEPAPTETTDTETSETNDQIAENTPEEAPDPIINSDAEFQSSLGSLYPDSKIPALFSNEEIIRKLVLMITNLADKKITNQHRALLFTPPAFAADSVAGLPYLSTNSFKRFNWLVDSLTAADPKDIAATYYHYLPLLEQAYAELGDTQTSFHDKTLKALKNIINAPHVNSTELLHRPSVFYKFADERLEKRPLLHKQLMRMGPDNALKIRSYASLLRDILENKNHDE